MWHFASNAIAGSIGLKNNTGTKPASPNPDCSDDDASSSTSREEGLECPICWESFNIVENVPYVLWCGHTLCKNCVLGLQSAVVKLPTTPIQLPLFINCPWCHLLSLRLVYRGSLKFPRKNFFLLWMVESMNSDRPGGDSPFLEDRRMDWPPASGRAHHHREGPATVAEASYLNMERINFSLRKSVAFFVNLTAKFPLVIIFLLIVIYAIPASAAILALYLVVTVLFALPSFLILYFAYPSLDWLVREIVT